ncbi:MAG TPA: DUF1295 domain-containing protein [Kiritimatiellia bacterium]|nr:DUF1295 domain-containing protein [Kiritimatiellia bacterium]
MNALGLFLFGWLAAALFMAALWLVQRRTGNAGIVDVGWAAGIATLALGYAALGNTDPLPRFVAGAMGALWGYRLAWHIHQRAHGKPEDGRYTQLRRDWGADFQHKLFNFYQLQAFTVALLALPYLFIATAPALTWGPLHTVGLAVWLTGWLGESVADAQLNAFKRNPNRTSPVCQSGLWRYSRHPNYFFEWLTWVGLALFALPAPYGWTAWLCAASILYLLFRVTGIPATEAQALRSKGDAYRAYQRTTSAFVPWFPRKDDA